MGKVRRIGYLAAGVLGVSSLWIMSANPESAHAACAYRWALTNGAEQEDINLCSGKSEDGTFSSTLKDDIITVELNNYQGSAFNYYNYGTGLAFKKIVIKLTGENLIDAGDQVAFGSYVPLEFTGSGSLTIRSTLPILGGGGYMVDDQPASATEILQKYAYGNGSGIGEVTIRPSGTSDEKTNCDETDCTELETTSPEKADPKAETDCVEKATTWPGNKSLLEFILFAAIIIVGFVAYHLGKKHKDAKGAKDANTKTQRNKK